jgi:hypothetical protein
MCVSTSRHNRFLDVYARDTDVWKCVPGLCVAYAGRLSQEPGIVRECARNLAWFKA